MSFPSASRLALAAAACLLGPGVVQADGPLETLPRITGATYGTAVAPETRRRLERAVEHAAASDRMRSLVVLHRGELAVEAHFHGQLDVAAQNLKSVTKTLQSLLVGAAIARGRLAPNLDATLGELLSGRFASGAHRDKAGITLRQLLTMASGVEPLGYGPFQAAPDWGGAILAQPLAGSPGRAFAYDTPVLQLLNEVLERAVGGDLVAFARRELLAPIGGTLELWRTAPEGVPMGGTDAYLRADHLALLGELVRRGGVWNDRRLVDERYLAESISNRISPAEPTINHGTLPVAGYGYLWWLVELGGETAPAALGHGGQVLVVLPRRELVVVVTSHWPGPSSTEHYRHLRSLLDEHLLPAFPLPGDPTGTKGTS